MHKKALIIVDMQNDFVTGSLAIPHAQEIIQPIVNIIKAARNSFLPILYSRDWHPKDHCSFKINGGSWPVHCVQGTTGALLVKEIERELEHPAIFSIPIFKGMEKDVEQYSAYTTRLKTFLELMKITSIEVCGLARDYCVKATVKDLKDAGYYVKVLENLCRSVN